MNTIKMRIISIGIFLLLTLNIFSQNITIQGVLIDTLQEPLISATVVLLNPQDSTMEYFGISNTRGIYKIKGVKKGKYLFQASYVGYQSRYKMLDLEKTNDDLQMGLMMLQPENKLLGEVTVNADRVPILIKKDTVEYNAGSFKVKPNADVEALLKKLPGVEVEKDGTIRAQGEVVQSIKVDGKDFFGNDPKIATQNLPADAVDKVQVFDKKSDMAEFTGVDDGQRNKTINLKLKDGKNKGYFGKISAGYGTEDRFEGKANVNRFTKKSQVSFLGRMNNINEQGFSFNDYVNFSGGFQNVMSELGGNNGELNIGGGGGNLPFGTGQQNYGFMNTGSGGANFNYDFSKKTEFSGSYFFNRLKRNQSSESFRQNFLEKSTYPSEEKRDQTTINNNHRLNIKLKSKIDSNQILTLRGGLTMSDRIFDEESSSRIFNVDNVLENTSTNKNGYDDLNLNANVRLTYLLKFKKAGRSLSANLNGGIRNNDRENELESINFFGLTASNTTFSDSLLQTQNQTGFQAEYALQLTYTEPIGKQEYLQFRYNRRNYNNKLSRDAFDIQNEIKLLNPSLSTAYNRDYFYDRAGLVFKMNRKKYIFSTGAEIQHSKLDGEIENVINPIEKNIWAVLPSLNLNYDFASSNSLSFSYLTDIREPSLEQLQPLVNNTNPLNLYAGNPELKPEYNHRLDLRYMLFDQFNFRSFFASLNTTFTQNKITNSRTVDSLFIQTTQPLNVRTDWATRGYLDFSTPLRFIRSKINLGINGNYNRGILFLNKVENQSERWNTSLDFNIENRKKDIVDILFGATWSFNQTKYSEAKNFEQKFNSITYYSDLNLSLKKGWTLGTSFDYTIYNGADFGDQKQVPMWNASIEKPVLKNRGTIELSARDLLNQGIGVDRRSNLNYIEDVEINSLGRYLMLTFSYSLTMLGEQSKSGIFIQEGGRRRN